MDLTWNRADVVHDSKVVQFHLMFATANVLTLEAGSKRFQTKGLLQTGRIATLQAQMSASGYHIIGIQESRTHGSLTRHSSSHLVYQSGAAASGNRGCELWLDRAKAYTTVQNQQFCFQPQHVHIADFSDRHLCAILRAPYLHLCVFVLHAPSETCTDIDPAQWWSNLDDVYNRIVADLPVVILGDMNARLGSTVSEAVSSHAAEEESFTGQFVHSFALDHQLWLPSTFSSCHEGKSTTWVSTAGTQHRIDYVLLPQKWRNFEVRSTIAEHIDLLTSQPDHSVVVAEVHMQLKQSCARYPKNHRIDVRKCQQPSCVAKFQEHLKTPPLIPWTAGVGEHAEHLVSWIQRGAQECFAPDHTLPRQRYMSNLTWKVVQMRKELLRMSKKSDRHVHTLTLKFWFLAWTWALDFCPAKSQQLVVISRLRWQCMKMLHWTINHRNRLHVTARQMSRQDRVHTTQLIIEEFYAAAKGHDSRAIYRALRPMLGQSFRKNSSKFQPIPAVRSSEGHLARNACEATEIWRSHFSEPEAGILVDPEQLKELTSLSHKLYSHEELPLDSSSLPSLQDIEAYIMGARRGKSPGLDGIPAEVYQLNPGIFAHLLWPLISKCVLRCAEPLRWRGGAVVAIPKTIHTSFAASQHRSILLADFLAKLRHGLVRKKLLPYYADFRLCMQAGGTPKLSTDFLHLYVQSFAHLTRTQSLSSASVFVDIRQAFYRACRPLLAASFVSDTQIAQFFASQGWSSDMMADFRIRLAEQDALSQASVSPHLQAQVRDLISGTWFQMKTDPATLTHTASGTRPGDAIADLLFAFIMRRYLAAVRQKLITAELQTTLNVSWLPCGLVESGEFSEQHILQASWVDDLVIMLQADTPAGLLAKVQATLAILQDTAIEFALQLNYGPDKTNVLMFLRGPTARATWQTLLQPGSIRPKLRVCCKSLPEPFEVDIVVDYVYLGTLQDQTGHPGSEVRRRFLSVRPMQKLLRRNVFRSPQLPQRTKTLMFRSLVLSKILYGAGAWQQMNIHSARSFHSQLIGIIKTLAPAVKPGPGIYNLDFLAAAKFVSPEMLLACQRFSLFDRLCQTDMSELFALLQHQHQHHGWLALVSQDIHRTSKFVSQTCWQNIQTAQDMATVAQMCYVTPGILARLGKQMCRLQLLYLEIWNQVRTFQKQFDHDEVKAGHVWHQHMDALPQSATYECEQCHASFSSFKALCSHMFQVHGTVNMAQQFARTNVCLACLKVYDSRVQVVHHLKYYRTGCLLKLATLIEPMTHEEVATAQQEARETAPQRKGKERKARHKYPVMRAHGPLRPWPWQRALSKLRPLIEPTLALPLEELQPWILQIEGVFEAGTTDDILEVLMQMPYHPEHAHKVLVALCPEADCSLHPPDILKQLMLQDALQLWKDHHDGASDLLDSNRIQTDQACITLHEVRLPETTIPSMTTQADKRSRHFDALWDESIVPFQLQRQLQAERNRQYRLTPQIPVSIKQKPIFVYVFSGRRRKGDFQTFIEHHLARHSLQGQTLLLDLALSDSHDVGNAELVTRLLDWISSGAVGGLLLAPPCETWSEARYREVEGEKTPRPVRSALEPMGIPGLTKDELLQVLTANMLLLVSFRLLFAAAVHGVPGILEHPRTPKKPDRPSIWRLPWLQRMVSNKLLSVMTIYQGNYGSISPKPTNLGYCNLPRFAATMKSLQTPIDWDHIRYLEGKDQKGSWMTSYAKEYPERMNSALAQTLIEAVAERLLGQTASGDIPDTIQAAFNELYCGDDDQNQQTMRPDYAKHLEFLTGMD
eukprot:Skav228891  [mRNA]  locus=scaffold194:214370:219709:+ [translate_table: standard]